jgi:LuxR family maltose regulon positive regulatory protein
MKIITSKVMVPSEIPLICREGLLDTLRENLKSCQATVINGRAGSGKTMLAADFIRLHMRNAAWYKIDAPDISLPVFIEYLVASIERVRPGFGSETLACQARSCANGARAELVAAALADAYVYDLERQTDPLLLVIDDLHLIYDADWLVPFFHRLLPLLPVEMHMLILGRGLPPNPLWRLRSKQRLFVVTEQMLAFTQSEAEKLFSFYAADLHENAIRAGAACMIDCST